MYQASNRRDFDRVAFAKPIQTSIKLLTPYDDVRSTDPEEIVVLDMSAGGLRFVSKAEFKVHYLAIYKIDVVISDKEVTLYGKIIRKKKLPQEFFEYGFKFNYDVKDQKKFRITYE
ncbi:PilZ domain-containing protein [Pseudalkalibacillus berkeleyi]|uniref:PilZ domain-containing protein n=1 Tax=Pseudalkalibacillus berkeleyi TaxID=1069813 RepID=A0ABS9H103_9BACL|nr:PilZ domain-containing protein [Pseudalkalibacillus berkeleyi]MCF6138679.1 PilZ domain-containing protein [Pseudalkalibacillus berkeleyi]